MSDDNTNDSQVQIDLIGSTRMEKLGSAEKIDLIIRGVQDGKIVILETGLHPDEESKLIERTMGSIDPNGFSGIEIETYPTGQEASSGFMNRLLSREEQQTDRMTVVAPADRMKTLEKDEDLISTVITKV